MSYAIRYYAYRGKWIVIIEWSTGALLIFWMLLRISIKCEAPALNRINWNQCHSTDFNQPNRDQPERINRITQSARPPHWISWSPSVNQSNRINRIILSQPNSINRIRLLELQNEFQSFWERQQINCINFRIDRINRVNRLKPNELAIRRCRGYVAKMDVIIENTTRGPSNLFRIVRMGKANRTNWIHANRTSTNANQSAPNRTNRTNQPNHSIGALRDRAGDPSGSNRALTAKSTESTESAEFNRTESAESAESTNAWPIDQLHQSNRFRINRVNRLNRVS